MGVLVFPTIQGHLGSMLRAPSFGSLEMGPQLGPTTVSGYELGESFLWVSL